LRVVGTCLLLIVVIWLVAVTISLPLAIYQHLVWIDDDDSAAGFYSCEENWPGPESRRIFTVISNLLQRRQLDNNDAIYINTDINYDDIYTDICHSDRSYDENYRYSYNDNDDNNRTINCDTK